MGVRFTEHEKLEAVHDQSQAQGELLEWLAEDGFVLCRHNEDCFGDEFIPNQESITSILARFHGIDLNELEREKDAMIDMCRGSQKS
jgi:hypothetical protein